MQTLHGQRQNPAMSDTTKWCQDCQCRHPADWTRKCGPPSSLAAMAGCSDRMEQLKAELNERRLKEIGDMLDDAGVPEWVENTSHKGVPSNGVVSRMKWYLARRKNVKASEIDQKLQRDMKAAEIHAHEYTSRYNVWFWTRQQL